MTSVPPPRASGQPDGWRQRLRRWCVPALLCACPSLSLAESSLRAGDIVALCGDSITEQRFYTILIADYLTMCQPVPLAAVHQFGSSGETVAGLHARLVAEVLPFKPTVATTLYGMNDGGYRPADAATTAKFERETEAVITLLQGAGTRLALIASPSAVDAARYATWPFAKGPAEEYNANLAGLGQAAASAAQRHGAQWVDVHGAMLAAMAKARARYGRDYYLASDSVHPAPNGQLVIAYTFLRALGCSGEIGTLTLDALTGQATATEGHRVLSASPTELSLESQRYPFCFTDDPARPDSTTAVLDCVPFHDELNRFQLIVRHAPGPMQVTWGGTSREYTAEQLAAGVNLAAAFPDNPFREPFTRVEERIKALQEFETTAVKTLLHSLVSWRRYYPEKEALFAGLEADVLARDHALQAAVRADVLPVRHVIKITPVARAAKTP